MSKSTDLLFTEHRVVKNWPVSVRFAGDGGKQVEKTIRADIVVMDRDVKSQALLDYVFREGAKDNPLGAMREALDVEKRAEYDELIATHLERVYGFNMLDDEGNEVAADFEGARIRALFADGAIFAGLDAAVWEVANGGAKKTSKPGSAGKGAMKV